MAGSKNNPENRAKEPVKEKWSLYIDDKNRKKMCKVLSDGRLMDKNGNIIKQ